VGTARRLIRSRVMTPVRTISAVTAVFFALACTPAGSPAARNLESDACSALQAAGALVIGDLRARGTVNGAEVAIADGVLAEAVAKCRQAVAKSTADAGRD
jgi:hypothetical protein